MHPHFLGGCFGARLSSSLGTKSVFYAENWIAVTRLTFAAYCILWAHVALPSSFQRAWMVQGFLNTYLLCSILLFIVLRLHQKADASYQLTAIAIDLLFTIVVTSISGSQSPYSILFIFVVVSSAYRWGARVAFLFAAACVLVFFAEIAVSLLRPWHHTLAAQASRTATASFLQGSFIFIVSLLLSYIIARERGSRAEGALLARVLGQTLAGSKIEIALSTLFAEIGVLYRPEKCLVALQKEGGREVFYREFSWPVCKSTNSSVKTILQFSNVEEVAFTSHFPSVWFLEGGARPAIRSQFLAYDEHKRRVKRSTVRDLESVYSLQDCPCLMVGSFQFGQGMTGRLILLNPDVQNGRRRALWFLQRLLKQFSPTMQSIYISREIRTRVEDQVRAQLARELHDGTLPSLLSAEMQIEVMHRQFAKDGNGLGYRLSTLQALIRQEALNLRDLIENTKPLKFAPDRLPDHLAELVARFRRETGISVRLETGDDEINLNADTCHELLRIVQEGLSNVRKHSGARNVVIKLYEGEDGHRKLLIADDGQGFGFKGRVTQTQLDASHRGPGVIKERVRMIGGELTIDSSPEHGARLEITIPDSSYG